MASTIRHIVAEELLGGHLNDKSLRLVNITDVKMSGDLHEAYIYWTLLDDSVDRDVLQNSLNAIGRHLRGVVGKKLETRLSPEIKFTHDSLGENVDAIEDVLAKAQLSDARLEKAVAAKNPKYAGEQNPYKEPKPKIQPEF